MSVNGVCTVSEQEWYSLFGEIDKTAPNDSFMAMCAEVGTLVKTQEKKVDELWAKVIKEKDSDALVTLGHMYVQGVDGLSCDCSQAARLFCRAAEAENSEGIISLYNLFLACTKDDEKSDKERKIIEKLSLIAEKKNPGALFCLGDHYLRTSATQDLKVEEKARNFLLQAAQLGNSQAMIRLADQVPCDLQEATALCTKAIAAGNTAGYGVMGILYFFKDDMSKGIGYLQQGVKAGDLNSMLMLAKELGYGDSLPRNEDKALELFQKLADRGWHGMLSQKALIYLRVKKWKEAVAILEKAIPCENRGLMSLLSSLYYLRGDARLGYECLSKAAYCEMDIGALYRLGVKIELGEDGRVRDKREAHRLLCLLTAKKLEFQDNHRRLLSSH